MLNRTNQNIISEWWYTVDRVSVFLVCILMCLGVLACATASPPVALRIGVREFFFLKKHILHITMSVISVFGLSLMTPKQIKITALPCISVLIIIMTLTPVLGMEIKGAKRWMVFYGMQMQPSELLRPWLVIITAWLLDIAYATRIKTYYLFSVGLYVFLTLCLLAQPDVGMTVMIAMVWITQVFMSRLNLKWIAGIFIFLFVCCCSSYMLFPHVRQRVHNFLNTDDKAAHYQIAKSMDAFSGGGLFGLGPGQGYNKNYIPDSHSDFIFSVIGEEFGLLACLFIMCAYLTISVRSILRVRHQNHSFCMCATIGLVTQLQLQVLINIGVVTRLLPTTGITMPFISYGGSSTIATGIAVGVILALTRTGNNAFPNFPGLSVTR